MSLPSDVKGALKPLIIGVMKGFSALFGLQYLKDPIGKAYPSSDKINEFEKSVFRQVNLNDELNRQGLKKIDVLNLDVEGAELEILKNLDFELFKPSVIAIEIHGNDLQECLNSDEAKLILNKGYQYVGSAVITQFFARKDEII